jgi:histidinol-phosphatase (PHP family)
MMKHMQNLHTHTIYCDGVNTPEELIQEAMRKGFESIGFSGHSYMKREPREYSMTADSNLLYKRKINDLKTKYANGLQVFLGMEADFYSDADRSGYDYLIGSVHYVEKDGILLDFDRTDIGRPADTVKYIIRDVYNGKGMDFIRDYYGTLARLPERGKTDIIGHFDLAVKTNGTLGFVDEDSAEYQYCAIEAAEKLAGKIGLFELNTGAVARGFRKIPYPAPFLLKELHRLGFGVVITSDCHRKENLNFYFKEAAELLKQSGFRERYILTENGFTAVEL